jgi:hypothetical protein
MKVRSQCHIFVNIADETKRGRKMLCLDFIF